MAHGKSTVPWQHGDILKCGFCFTEGRNKMMFLGKKKTETKRKPIFNWGSKRREAVLQIGEGEKLAEPDTTLRICERRMGKKKENPGGKYRNRSTNFAGENRAG